MLKNHNHDLVQQLSETSDSLWRIDEYLKNSKGCGHCEKLWSAIRSDLENVSQALITEINRHSKENRFD